MTTEPIAWGLLHPNGSLECDLVGTKEDCEYWARADGERQFGWRVVPLYGPAEIESLQAENFKLAAGQCPNVVGDEGGTPRCAEIARLTAERDALRAALAELVACNDLKEKGDACWRWPSDEDAPRLAREYSERKGPALDAARAALDEVGR